MVTILYSLAFLVVMFSLIVYSFTSNKRRKRMEKAKDELDSTYLLTTQGIFTQVRKISGLKEEVDKLAGTANKGVLGEIDNLLARAESMLANAHKYYNDITDFYAEQRVHQDLALEIALDSQGAYQRLVLNTTNRVAKLTGIVEEEIKKLEENTAPQVTT